jgi:hypothetical protein
VASSEGSILLVAAVGGQGESWLDGCDFHGQESGASAAARGGVTFLDPEFARDSSWTQVESVNRLLRETPPDRTDTVVLEGSSYPALDALGPT